MIREILDYCLSVLKSRLLPVIIVFLVLISILVNRLFSLQIINGQSYVKDLTESIQKTTSVPAARGRIYDKNGVLLAYNDLAYAVKISDSGTYANKQVKNATLNNAIDKTLKIIESKNDKYTNNYQIKYADGSYSFDVTSSTSLLRFLRDSYGESSISALSDEERNASATDVVNFLCNKFEINQSSYTPDHILEIINLRCLMQANSYNRYMSFTISSEVSDETVAAILENADELVGVTVEQQYVRKYIDSVCCSQILGYTGTVSSSELEDLQSQNSSYEASDIVGKSGIEKSMESELSGTKGSKTVYVDTVGRITQVLSQTDATAGHDVYLTIDVNLQQKIYNAIEDELVTVLTGDITDSNSVTETVSTNSEGSTSVSIPMGAVYNALINNNVVSLNKIAEGTTANEQTIYNTFLGKQSEEISWLNSQLTDSPTTYGKLTTEQQDYIWYIYKDLLVANNIFDVSKVDASDPVYIAWKDGDTESLEDLLKYAISKNWIDMSSLTTEQYTSLQESYDALLSYIMTAIQKDNSFNKLIYKYMISSGAVTGRQVCMLLFEQGVFNDDSTYASLNSGKISSYSFLLNAITTKQITPAQLALEPCSGSAVVTDPKNGDVLALVSYPSYDNNKMSGTVDADYYNQLSNDNSKPLLNWATQSQTAPGSTFKPCSAIAGLDTGIITTSTQFLCTGAFTEVTPSPKCWLLSGHGLESVSTALKDSCNVFFYNVGYKLACSKNGSYNSTYGTSILQKYAEELGLATKSGIEIEESTPQASNTQAIPSAIGQGNHAYSCLNLARYVTTLATSGTCYNLTLVDKITDSDGNLIRDNQATVSNTVDVSSSTWDAVRSGMVMASQTYFGSYGISGLNVAAKSGTAQERTTDPDHSLLISYAPYSDPTVAMSVVIPHGNSSASSKALTSDIYKIYYGMK